MMNYRHANNIVRGPMHGPRHGRFHRPFGRPPLFGPFWFRPPLFWGPFGCLLGLLPLLGFGLLLLRLLFRH